MFYRRLGCVLVVAASGFAFAQVAVGQTTNNIDAPSNAQSTANPVVDLNQNGSLVNTQVNNFPLGRSVVGNGVADCTRSGIALSAFGNGNGPFDTGSLGGSVTYTHSFGVDTCKKYANIQLAKSKLETCLLLISNYSKITKAGIDVSYPALRSLTGINCPNVTLPGATNSFQQQSFQQSSNGTVFVPAPQASRPEALNPSASVQVPVARPVSPGSVSQPVPQEFAPPPQGPVATRTHQGPSSAPPAQSSSEPLDYTPVQAPDSDQSGPVELTYAPIGNEGQSGSRVYDQNAGSPAQSQGIVAQTPQPTILNSQNSRSAHHSTLAEQPNSPNQRRQPNQGPVFIQY